MVLDGFSGNRPTRIAAGILGSLLILILLFSGIYIGFESDHDCTGEDCHICQCIDVCGDILNSAFDIRTITATSAVHLFLTMLLPAFISLTVPKATPVDIKVRLNN